uniref:Uncharacterized protein n=1 Tax=Setaria italica TaxID=4555 RepID=K3YA46_SETIT
MKVLNGGVGMEHQRRPSATSPSCKSPRTEQHGQPSSSIAFGSASMWEPGGSCWPVAFDIAVAPLDHRKFPNCAVLAWGSQPRPRGQREGKEMRRPGPSSSCRHGSAALPTLLLLLLLLAASAQAQQARTRTDPVEDVQTSGPVGSGTSLARHGNFLPRIICPARQGKSSLICSRESSARFVQETISFQMFGVEGQQGCV